MTMSERHCACVQPYVFETAAMLKAIILSEIEMALPGNEGNMFTMQTVIYNYHVSHFQVAVNERR